MVAGLIPCRLRPRKCPAGPKENLTREAVVGEVIKEEGVVEVTRELGVVEEEEGVIKVEEGEDIKVVEGIEVIKEVEGIGVIKEGEVETIMVGEAVETTMEMEVVTKEGVDVTHIVVEEVEVGAVGAEEEVGVSRALAGAVGVVEGAIAGEVIKAFLLDYTYLDNFSLLSSMIFL